MSAAAAHFHRFKEEAVRNGRVYTLMDGTNHFVFPMGDHVSIPFWSSRSQVEVIPKTQPKLASGTIREISIAEFLTILPRMQADGVRVGANWSGRDLTGYDVEAKDVEAGLKYWIEKLKPPG